MMRWNKGMSLETTVSRAGDIDTASHDKIASGRFRRGRGSRVEGTIVKWVFLRMRAHLDPYDHRDRLYPVRSINWLLQGGLGLGVHIGNALDTDPQADGFRSAAARGRYALGHCARGSDRPSRGTGHGYLPCRVRSRQGTQSTQAFDRDPGRNPHRRIRLLRPDLRNSTAPEDIPGHDRLQRAERGAS